MKLSQTSWNENQTFQNLACRGCSGALIHSVHVNKYKGTHAAICVPVAAELLMHNEFTDCQQKIHGLFAVMCILSSNFTSLRDHHQEVLNT
jgi:hypothetical protein